MILLKMAWRNNWRHRWRSSLTIAAIVFGLGITIWGFCLTDGSHEQLITNSVESFSGHMQIHRQGYHDDPGMRKSFAPDSTVMSALRELQPEVSNWGRRIDTYCLASIGETSFAAMLVGIEPERESEFIHWDEKLSEGEYLEPGDRHGVLIGENLAENLTLALGDTVIIVTQDYYGALTGALRVVRGTFRSHSPELDRSGLLMSLESAQDILSLGDRVTTVVVMTGSADNVDPVAAGLRERFGDRELEVIPWYDILPDLVQAVELDNIFGLVTNMVLILVIGFMVLNTFLMGVMERIREFGIMRSLGTSPARVVGVIALEAALLVLVGFAIANLVGVGAAWYNTIHPLDFSNWGEEVYEMFGMDPRIYANLNLEMVFWPNAMVLAVILLALIYPAWRASRISPAEAISRRK